jgi:uracil-DNA glycosylase
MAPSIAKLVQEVRRCKLCAPHLPHGPRPVVQIGATARLVIVGQAPGSKVHASGVPWNDDSGERLREWTGMDAAAFYDPGRVALIPMGFCYPGAGQGADLPPRPECAPLWHERMMAVLPKTRLTLLVGTYSQAHYLRTSSKMTMTETVRGFRRHMPLYFPLPHPSWRSVGWMRRNPGLNATSCPSCGTRCLAH